VAVPPEDKTCRVCGRRMTWRRAWARDWDARTVCSDACRKRRGEVLHEGHALEQAILALLASRPGSVCPSEIARAAAPQDWRALMEPVREAARRLVARGLVVITQRGRVVDPSTARGAIRIARAER